MPGVLGIGLAKAHLAGMKRPSHLKHPKHLSPSPPVPKPQPLTDPEPPAGEEERPDPTRFGDWEKKGIAIDF